MRNLVMKLSRAVSTATETGWDVGSSICARLSAFNSSAGAISACSNPPPGEVKSSVDADRRLVPGE